MWNILIPGIMGILKKVIPDPKERAKAEKQISDHMSQMIKAESNSESWMTRIWRPYLMFSITNLIVIWGINNFLVRPYVKFFGYDMPLVEVPQEFWNLLLVGFGIYGGARTFEKVMDKALYMMTRRK